jgi:excisionase family DNA binding protein
MPIERTRDIFTPEQAADYLQINRETVYRYIREGKLVASRLGRAYRIPRRSLDLLLWATRTRQDLSLREYTGEQIAEFIKADTLDEEAQDIAGRFLKSIERTGSKRSEDLNQKSLHP